MNLAERGGRTLLWNQGLRMGEFGLMFASSLLYARWLGPAAYGRYSLVIATVGLLPLFAGFGLEEALSSYLARLSKTDGQAEQVYLVRFGLAIRTLTGVLLGAALCVCPGLFARLSGNGDIAAYLPYAAPYLLTSQVFSLLLNVALGRLASGLATSVRLISLAASFGLAAALLHLGLEVRAIVIALGVSSSGAVAWLLWADRHFLFGPARPIDLAAIWRFGRTAWLLNVANYILGKQLDLFVVSLVLGQAALVGAYNIALGLATTIGTLFIAGLGGAALPLYSAVAARGDEKGLAALWRANVLFTTILGIPVGVFALYTGPYIIQRLYGSGYSAAVLPFQITMVLATASRVAGGGASATLLYARDRQRPLVLVRGGAAVVNAALDFALVPRLGLGGAALATGLTGVAITLVELQLARRVSRLSFPLLPTIKIGAAASLALLPLTFLPIASPLALVGASVLYAATCVPLLGLLRPLAAPDLLWVQRLHPRLRRVAGRFASVSVAPTTSAGPASAAPTPH